MKKIIPFISLLILFSVPVLGFDNIESKDAAFYEGKDVVACGIVKQVSKFKSGYYLNLDNKYPQQSLTFVIWDNDLFDFNQRHGDLSELNNKKVCGKGLVKSYKGRPQIVLYNSYSLKLD